jgi:hypothetical protein
MQEPHHDLRPEGRRHVPRYQDGRREALAISVPRGEAALLKYFQARMPYGLFAPDVSAQ